LMVVELGWAGRRAAGIVIGSRIVKGRAGGIGGLLDRQPLCVSGRRKGSILAKVLAGIDVDARCKVWWSIVYVGRLGAMARSGGWLG